MRVDRCFAFVDLCGFTTFADQHGDDPAVAVLAELRAVLREISARRGVRVVKWLGDGAMLSSTMTDAVVASAVEVRSRLGGASPSLPLRTGISSGPVIMFEGDDYIGRPVNVAARLCAAAAPGQVLATEEVLAALPAWVRATGSDLRPLRGLEATVPVVEIEPVEAGDDGVVDPVCGLVVPRAAAVTAAGGAGAAVAGGEVLFCSEACAGSWPVPAS